MGHSAPVWDHNAAVELTQDWNGIDQIVLRNPQGASARVSLHGGQVTSWRSDRGEELLFTSNKERSEHKRVRTHYSQLPEEEKEWLRARKKTLAAEWKEKESQLVLVDIQQVDDLANPIEVENLSSFSAAQIYNHRNLTAAASGSSTLQPHNRQDEYYMVKLLNVSIGVTLATLTPLRTVWQPAVPAESYELPAVARCMFCKAIFKPPKAMRGGIPICFPQFGNCGSHGICKEQNMDPNPRAWGLVVKSVVNSAQPPDRRSTIQPQALNNV